MKYQFSCPACGVRLSRWRIFTTLTLDYHCRDCGATFRLSLLGWMICLGVIALQFLCFGLSLKRVIPPFAAIALLAVICGLTLWLLPYLTPVRSGRPGARDRT